MDIKSAKVAEYFSRQMTLSSFGKKNQEKLARASALIIGCGGLGCPAALYLATSGVGRIGLCDFDTIELHNISRQVLFSIEDVGKNKALQAQYCLSQRNPYAEYITYTDLLDEKPFKISCKTTI